MADYLTFDDLQNEVHRAVKDYQESQANLVKMVINQVYLTEILQADNLYPMFWLLDLDDSRKSVAPKTISGISIAANAIVTCAAHTFIVGDLVTIHGVSGMTEINDLIAQVTAVPDTTHITLSINSAAFTAYTSGGTVHHRGVTLNTAGKPVQSVYLASWHNEDRMEKISPNEIENDPGKYHYTDATARPERWYFGKGFSSTGVETNQLIWHPGADAAYRLRVWLELRPSRLSAAADVPMLPPVFHDAIIAGAITRLAENNVQVESQIIWPGIYKGQLEALKTFNRKYYEVNRSNDWKTPYLL